MSVEMLVPFKVIHWIFSVCLYNFQKSPALKKTGVKKWTCSLHYHSLEIWKLHHIHSDLCQNEDGKNYCMKQKNGTFCCICLFGGNQFSKHGILCLLRSTTTTTTKIQKKVIKNKGKWMTRNLQTVVKKKKSWN